MSAIPLIEKIPQILPPKTINTNLGHGVLVVLTENFGQKITNEIRANCIELDNMRNQCINDLSKPNIPFSDIKYTIINYCYQLTCLLQILNIDGNYAPYFEFSWERLDNIQSATFSDPKFDLCHFLLALVISIFPILVHTKVSVTDINEKIDYLSFCESILAYLQNETPHFNTVNFYPGILSILMSLIQLFHEQLLCGLLCIKDPRPYDMMAKSYANQARISDNLKFDLETSIPNLQQAYQHYADLKYSYCQIMAFVNMSDSSTDISESFSYFRKAESLLKETYSKHRDNLGVLQEYFEQAKKSVLLKHTKYSQFDQRKLNQLPEPHVPFVNVSPAPVPFSFSSITGLKNMFGSLTALNENLAQTELQFRKKCAHIFNETLSNAQKLTDEYYVRIAGFDFGSLFCVDEEIPKELVSFGGMFANFTEIMKELQMSVDENTNLINKIKYKTIQMVEQPQIGELEQQVTENGIFLQVQSDKDIKYLQMCLQQDFQNLPSVTDNDLNIYKNDFLTIHKLLGKGEDMVTQRNELVTKIKEQVLNIDTASLIFNNDAEKMADEVFNKIENVQLLTINLSAQNKLIDILISKNANVSGSREKIRTLKKRRSEAIVQLMNVKNIVESLLKNLQNRLKHMQDCHAYLCRLDENVLVQQNSVNEPNVSDILGSAQTHTSSKFSPEKEFFDPRKYPATSTARSTDVLTSQDIIFKSKETGYEISKLLAQIELKHQELGSLLSSLNQILSGNKPPSSSLYPNQFDRKSKPSIIPQVNDIQKSGTDDQLKNVAPTSIVDKSIIDLIDDLHFGFNSNIGPQTPPF